MKMKNSVLAFESGLKKLVDTQTLVDPAAVSYFSGMGLCSDRIDVRKERTGLGTGFIR